MYKRQRSSIIYSKHSCHVTDKSGIAIALYSQAANTALSLSSSTVSVKTESESLTESNSSSKPTVKDLTCTFSHRNTVDAVCKVDEDESKEWESDSVATVNTPPPNDGLIATHCHTSDPKTLVFECDNKTDLCKSSDMLMGNATYCPDNMQQNSSIDVTADRSIECAIQTESEVVSMVNNFDKASHAAADQAVDDRNKVENIKLSQLPVQNATTSDVFLDTRNIAGTTPPRSDISFGFDPSDSPEPVDVSVSQHVSPSDGTCNAVVASCHGPVVAPMPPPVAGCTPILYFYPAMPVTLLPPVATFATGRCTPVGVVPPMPAVADMSDITVAASAWQSTENKLVCEPVPPDGQNMASTDDTATSDAPTLNKPTNQFVLSAAQRYLYAGMPSS